MTTFRNIMFVLFALVCLLCGGSALRAADEACDLTSPSCRVVRDAQFSTSDEQTAQGSDLGAISGVVLDASDRRPVGRAYVQLGRVGAPALTELADETGRFVFAGLHPASYSLMAEKAGYADGRYGGGGGLSAAAIVVARGQWVRDLTIELARLGVISGSVVDEVGAPCVGATVRVLQQVLIGGERHMAAGPFTKTDDRGQYRIANLRPGKYFVAVPSPQHSVPRSATGSESDGRASARRSPRAGPAGRSSATAPAAIVDGQAALIVGSEPVPTPAQDGRPRVYPTIFYPGSLTIAGAAPVEVAAGSEMPSVDFALQAVPAVRVSGRLRGAGTSYVGMLVRLMAEGLETLGDGSETATALADPSGSFTFLNVPAGNYTLVAPGSAFELTMESPAVSVSSPWAAAPPGAGRGHGSINNGLISTADGVRYNSRVQSTADEHAGYARLSITVGDRDLVGLDVPLLPSSVIAGRIVVEDIDGPVAGGALELAPADGSPALTPHTAGIDRDELGTAPMAFRIPAVIPGEYALRTIGMGGVTIKSITLGGEDVTTRPLRIVPGHDPSLTVVVTGKATGISGAVRDREGRPAPLAAVIAYPVDAGLWSHYGFTPTWIRTSRAGSDGRYELKGIRAGEYFVVAVSAAEGHGWREPPFLEALTGSATRVTIDWGDQKQVDLRMTGQRK